MFYRRKVILALLQAFGGELDKISLQKLLFLFTKRQPKPDYDFIPYKFGCYSYSANADLTTMVTKKYLSETESSFQKIDPVDYVKLLNENDKRILVNVKSLYGKFNAGALMKHTYTNYPYWAINSTVAASILNDEELAKVDKAKNVDSEVVLFTIGYEGISLEEYLNRLLRNNVKVLIDVRANPLSMKFGFSKHQLKKYCDSLGVQYMHIPEVGIQSEERQELNTQVDYDKLFIQYKKNNLSKTISSQQNILDILLQYKRVALTCFEANICQCHRKHLAEAITLLPGFEYNVKHI